MDRHTFKTLFAGFKSQLTSYLYRLLADRNDVDDLTHDTFIRAFTKISTFNRESSLKTWVFQVATNLAYDHLREICLILGKTEGVIKHLLNDARNTMTDIFDSRCALINKNGVCHQCSHINEIFNPKQDQQAELMKLELVKGSKKYNREELFALRTTLVKAIDPLHASGTDLHEVIMKCVRTAIGEKSDLFTRSSGS